MNTRFSIFSLLIGTSLSVGFFVLSAQGATTYQMTLAECQKRTGLSAGLCRTFIKKNLNVENCKKQTGLSDEACTTRIEEIKNDPEFSGVSTPTTSRSNTSDERAARSVSVATQSGDGIVELRTKKERALTELRSKTEKAILFLKERGAEVSVLEANFGELEKKSDELLLAYTLFQDVYAGTAQDPVVTRQAIRAEARGMVDRSRNAFVEYYQSNILSLLLIAREQIL
jgi:hypothetical protein